MKKLSTTLLLVSLLQTGSDCFFLPGYSPELNPDELLNQDVKSNSVGRHRAKDKTELVKNVRSYLRSRQGRLLIVQKFHGQHVEYAA